MLGTLVEALARLLQRALVLTYALALGLPVALVTDNVLQVLIHVDVLAAYLLGDLGDDVLWEADLAGDLDGEGAPRAPDGEAEEGAHLVAVVEHGAVDEPGMVLGVGLEVLVVRRDDAEGPLVIEAVQQRLSDGAAYGGLGAAAEFVD